MTSIFEPLTFRTGLKAPNRIVLAAMTNKQSHADGTLSNEEESWLYSRAEGGFGTVMTCAAHVSADGKGWHGELGIHDDAMLPGLTRLAKGLRERGAASMVQIFHGGLRADGKLGAGFTPWSAHAADGRRAGTEDDIARVIDAYASAAARAEAAGFDGVEIHGAHGYLLTQFLSTIENERTDAWGGTLENRAKLMRSVMRAARKRTKPGFTIGVRLSPEDMAQAKGLDLDESIQTAKWLVEDGADFIHLSLWRSALNTKKRPEEHPINVFRSALPKDIVVMAAGGVWTAAEANALVERGVDAVAIGRAAITNRDWGKLAAQPDWQPKRPPLSVAELIDEGLSPAFAEYMREWKNFVK